MVRIMFIFLMVCNSDLASSQRLPDMKGLSVTSSDISSDSSTLVVTALGSERCGNKNDGIFIFNSYDQGDDIAVELIHAVCGFYGSRRMEAITIINEEPLTTLVTAKNSKKVFSCVHDIEDGTSTCDEWLADVLVTKDFKKTSGVDTDSKGNLFVVANNTRWLFKFDQDFNFLAKYELPKLLKQADDVDVSPCNIGSECVFVADAGKYRDLIHMLDLQTLEWKRFRVKKRNQRAKVKAFSIEHSISEPYHGVLFYQGKGSPYDLVELLEDE